MSHSISSPRAYEVSQQHPISEELHYSVEAFLTVDGVLNADGIERLEDVDPIHSAANNRMDCISDEGCYSSSEIYDAVPYVLEVKSNEGGREAIALIPKFLDYEFSIQNGLILWADQMTRTVREHKSFELATRLLILVSEFFPRF